MAPSPPYCAVICQRHWRREMPFMLAVFALALALYAATSPHTVALEDDALFIGTLHFFGIAHPPGYPLHTLLGGIFYHLLPFGTPAYKAHLFSGVAAAAAAAAIYAVTAMLVPGRLAPLFAALAYTVSKTFWSQAIVAEVYTLNALLFFLLLALTLHYVATGNKKTLWQLAVVGGMGLANHYPLFILAASGILVYALPQISNKLRTVAVGCAISIATAAIFYWWMVWRSYDTAIPAHFYGLPMDSIEIFLRHLLRSDYAQADQQISVTWHDKLLAGKFLADEILAQYTAAGALLAGIGFIALLRHPRQWLLAISLLISLFMVSILLIIVRDFKASYLGLTIFRVYHLTSYGILAIALAIGAEAIATRLARTRRGSRRAVAAIAMAVIASTAATHWHSNNRRDYRWAEDLALAKLTSVDNNAMLFTTSDLDFPIGYLHYVKGVRPDLTVYNISGLIYGNPLYSSLAPDNEKFDILANYIDNSYRPIFFPPHTRPLFETGRRNFDSLGFYHRTNNQPSNRLQLKPAVLKWLQTHIDDDYSSRDKWTHIQHTLVIQRLVNVAVNAHYSGSALTPQWHDIISQARQQDTRIDTLITRLELVHNELSRTQAAQKLQQCRSPSAQVQHELDDESKALFYLVCAQLAWHAHRDNNTTEQYLLAALAQLITPENPALKEAFEHYQRRELPCRIVEIVEKFFADSDELPAPVQAYLQPASAACQRESSQ